MYRAKTDFLPDFGGGACWKSAKSSPSGAWFIISPPGGPVGMPGPPIGKFMPDDVMFTGAWEVGIIPGCPSICDAPG